MPEPAIARAPEPPETRAADRRAQARQECLNLPQVRYLVRPSLLEGRAALRDISAEGVGLLSNRRLEMGTVLFVQFPGVRRGLTHTQLARVMHSAPHTGGGWVVGCQLTPPLRDQDLALILRQLSRQH